MGAGAPRIVAVHILPNIIGPLLILASMDIPVVITIEAGLSFLGVGVPPPAPSWGSILSDGFSYIRNTPWPVIAGGWRIAHKTGTGQDFGRRTAGFNDVGVLTAPDGRRYTRSEEHTSELQSLMRISYAVFCLKKKKIQIS